MLDKRELNLFSGLHISNLRGARKSYSDYDGVISIEGAKANKGLRIDSPDIGQIVLKFDDVDRMDDRHQIVSNSDVVEAMEFARKYYGKKLLVHCHAGLCRSTAIALGVIADRLGPGREVEAVMALKGIRPNSVPNKLVLKEVDDYLGRGGRLVEAWMKVGERGYRVAGIRMLKNSLQVAKILIG